MSNEIDNETIRLVRETIINRRGLVIDVAVLREALRAAALVPAQRLREAESMIDAYERANQAWSQKCSRQFLENRDLKRQLRDAEARAERLEAALQAVADESRTLRQCGPFEEDALDLHNALGRAVNSACSVLAQQHDVPRTAYELWESVERNQCDGCARGLPIDEHGIHRGEGYDVIVCTADRYAYGDDHA